MSLSGSLPFRVKGARAWRTTLLQPPALVLTFVSLTVLATISAFFLAAHGVDYDTAGGGALAKIHPGTYLAAAALIARVVAAPHPVRTTERLLTREPGLVIYAAALGLLAVYVLAISRTPVTPLVDTFLLALILTLLVQGLDERIARLLALMLVAIFAADAIIALVEFATGWRLIHIPVPEGVTSDPTRTDLVFDWRADLATDWRATALFGHPLENAMLMGGFLVCLASPGTAWLGPAARLGLGLLAFLAMFAFGGRAALVFSMLCVTALGLRGFARQLVSGRGFGLRTAAIVLLLVPVVGLVILMIADMGLFTRVASRFASDDGSAMARLTMWSLFDPIPWRDLVLAPDQGVVKTWQRITGLEFGIESFWVSFALTYGLVMSAVLIAGLAAFVAAVVRLSGPGAVAVFVFYFAVASTSTSLSSKTVSFGILTALVLLLLRNEPALSERAPR